MDTNNSKVKPFIARINHIKGIYAKIRALESGSMQGKFTTDKAMQLAEYYRQVGQIGRFNNLLQSIMSNKKLPPQIQFQVALAYNRAKEYRQMDMVLNKCLAAMPNNTPPNVFLNIARLYSQSKNGVGMQNALKKYLAKQPRDWKAWLDLASIETQLKKPGAAREALGSALRYGGPQAREQIQKNPYLNKMLRPSPLQNKRLMGFGL